MSKQWGHGFYKGVEKAQESQSIIGLYFHSRENGLIKWQGKIIRDAGNGTFICQLYEWGLGTPNKCVAVGLSDMKEWDFYQTDRDMRYAWNKESGGTEEDFAWEEQLIAKLNPA